MTRRIWEKTITCQSHKLILQILNYNVNKLNPSVYIYKTKHYHSSFDLIQKYMDSWTLKTRTLWFFTFSMRHVGKISPFSVSGHHCMRLWHLELPWASLTMDTKPRRGSQKGWVPHDCSAASVTTLPLRCFLWLQIVNVLID